MGDDEAKRIILARRARFVAAAVASLNVAMCGGQTDGGGVDGGNPQPCLTPIQPDAGINDAGGDADAEPQPCLAPIPDDGGDGG